MKILIATDHIIFREGLKIQLADIFPDVSFLESSHIEETIHYLNHDDIDILLLSLNMSDRQWTNKLKSIMSDSKDTKTVIIPKNDKNSPLEKMINMGVKAYIPKETTPQNMRDILKTVMNGGIYLPPEALEKRTQTKFKLSRRQKEVLQYLNEGLSNKQIAEEMELSEATIKLHINSLLRKTNAKNRTQALIIAQQEGLI